MNPFLSDFHQWSSHHVMAVAIPAACGIVIVILTAVALYFYNLVRREKFRNRVLRSAVKKVSIKVPTDVIEMEEAAIDVSELPRCVCAKSPKRVQKPKKRHRRDEKKKRGAN